MAEQSIIMYSPPMRASYPHLNEPDNFKGKETYNAKLFGDFNDPEIKQFMKDQRDVAKRLGFEKLGPNVNLPMKRVMIETTTEDENGDEVVTETATDQVRLIVKSKFKPLFVNASGKTLTNPPVIGEDALLVAKIKCTAFEKGVALVLEAVQVLEAGDPNKTPTGGAGGGFGAREGYEDVIDLPSAGGFKARKDAPKPQDDDGGLEV